MLDVYFVLGMLQRALVGSLLVMGTEGWVLRIQNSQWGKIKILLDLCWCPSSYFILLQLRIYPRVWGFLFGLGIGRKRRICCLSCKWWLCNLALKHFLDSPAFLNFHIWQIYCYILHCHLFINGYCLYHLYASQLWLPGFMCGMWG